METALLELIEQLNPWLQNESIDILCMPSYIPRKQSEHLLLSEWDVLCTTITGPRQAGKTTLGKYISQQILQQHRYDQLFYLNCDYLEIRQWLNNTLFLQQISQQWNIKRFILFIDEVQRLSSPGLLLKAIVDLKLPIKLIASGSSQLEIKSKVQEYLTGREFECLVLPLSVMELATIKPLNDSLIFGSYPQIITSVNPQQLLQLLYQNYINKDIIEILRIGHPDILQKLVSLIAHSSGQLINYTQLATDCKVSTSMITHYLDILERTYVIYHVKPFLGNKRQEITSNPIYYFIDNGFRNQALRNFTPLETRTDIGFLVENYVFQEIFKYKSQHFVDFDINYWRTKGGAEVDFVLSTNPQTILPVEVKYRNLAKPTITRALRSFIEAYQPRQAVVINKNLYEQRTIENTTVHFIPLSRLDGLFKLIGHFAF